MALNLKKTFSAGVAGIVAGAALSMSAAFAEPAANTNQPQAQTVSTTSQQGSNNLPACKTLRTTSTGREITSAVSAHIYSEERPGNVGIFIYPGADLVNVTAQQAGGFLVAVMRQNGVTAECFIEKEVSSRGTSINFIINGIGIRDEPFGVDEITDKRLLGKVIAEAKTAEMVLASTSPSLSNN